MTSREIKAAMVLRGVKQAEIAKRLRLSPAYVSDVIAGNRKSEKVRRAVATAIGKPVDQVFGEAA